MNNASPVAVDLAVLVYAIAGVSWSMNLIHLLNNDIIHFSAMTIVRVVGVVLPPLGALLGFIP